jgi:hypothetical protein
MYKLRLASPAAEIINSNSILACWFNVIVASDGLMVPIHFVHLRKDKRTGRELIQCRDELVQRKEQGNKPMVPLQIHNKRDADTVVMAHTTNAMITNTFICSSEHTCIINTS